jgi:hypothetical protein
MEESEESIGSQFFAIQELLLLVLSYISPPGKVTMSSIDTKTLANLARVSRNLSNAALDALWRSMYQPAAIVRLLPEDTYQIWTVGSLDGDAIQKEEVRKPASTRVHKPKKRSTDSNAH